MSVFSAKGILVLHVLSLSMETVQQECRVIFERAGSETRRK